MFAISLQTPIKFIRLQIYNTKIRPAWLGNYRHGYALAEISKKKRCNKQRFSDSSMQRLAN
jgi:hypothetical protein